jgi:hypothetical protein
MKKLLMLLSLILITGAIYAQSIFKPVPSDLFPRNRSIVATTDQSSSKWLLRAQVAITAININLKTFETSSFSSIGPGIGWQHYVPGETEPFNDYGFSALFLIGQEQPELENVKAAFSIAIVANALGWINLGPIYDTRSGQFGILTGVSLKF